MKRRAIGFLLLIAALLSLAACAKQEATDEPYFIMDGAVYKQAAPLRPEQVLLAADKINIQIEAHPEAGSVYLAVIPDKGRYIGVEGGGSKADYDEKVDIICGAVPDAQYIDLFGTLSAQDFYRTDIHWRQERILPAAQALCSAMGAASPAETDFTKTELGEFTGALVAQSELSAEPEMLYTMESAAVKSAAVKDYEDKPLAIYSPEKLESAEPYDVFLSGAQPVITIESPAAASDRELVIFRDSFGSSLAPLLVEGYQKVTLVDLRYIQTNAIGAFIDFENQDVLFEYSTLMLNQGLGGALAQ